MRKRTEITVETDQILIIRRQKATRIWCRDCGSVTDFVSLEQAGRVLEADPKTLVRGANADKLHLFRTADGSLLVCLAALLVS